MNSTSTSTEQRVVYTDEPSKFPVGKVAVFLVLVLFSVFMVFPLLWMLSTSLKPNFNIFQFPPQWIPHPALWSNYGYLFSQYNILGYAKNTIFITAMNIIGTVFSSTVVAYGFAKYNVRGRNLLFSIVLGTMMIPWAVTLVPLFVMYRVIGWYNTYFPLWVPAFFGNPFFIFLLRQFIMTIPNEMQEAADIDGANVAQTLWYVIIPMLKPALAVVGIFTFFNSWNDFLGPLIFLSDPAKATLQLAIENLQTQFNSPWNYMMGFSLLSVVPCLVVFFIGQKQIIDGIALTGVKS